MGERMGGEADQSPLHLRHQVLSRCQIQAHVTQSSGHRIDAHLAYLLLTDPLKSSALWLSVTSAAASRAEFPSKVVRALKAKMTNKLS